MFVKLWPNSFWQVTRAGREGSVHVEGDSVVEGHAANNGDNSQLKVRRAPVYLGGAPPGAKHLPRPKLYRTGESLTSYRQRGTTFLHSKTRRVQRMHPPTGGGKQEGEFRGTFYG